MAFDGGYSPLLLTRLLFKIQCRQIIISSFLLTPDFFFLCFLILFPLYEVFSLLSQFFSCKQFIVLLIVFKIVKSQHSCRNVCWLRYILSQHARIGQLFESVHYLNGLMLYNSQENIKVVLRNDFITCQFFNKLSITLNCFKNFLNMCNKGPKLIMVLLILFLCVLQLIF